jgi:hypothetical protein
LAVPKGTKKPETPEPTNAGIRPLGEAVLRLVHSSVAARIRFRALLEILTSAEPFDFGNYMALYRRLCERDAAALISQIILTAEEYRRLFGEWENADEARYGHSQSVKQWRSRKEEPKPLRRRASTRPPTTRRGGKPR